jgi:hypothetical protein
MFEPLEIRQMLSSAVLNTLHAPGVAAGSESQTYSSQANMPVAHPSAKQTSEDSYTYGEAITADAGDRFDTQAQMYAFSTNTRNVAGTAVAEMYLSTSSDVQGDILGNASTQFDLAPGAGTRWSVNVTIPDDTKSGTYDLVAYVDVSQSNSDNSYFTEVTNKVTIGGSTLKFVDSPDNGPAGVPLSETKVEVLDDNGKVNTDDNSDITLALDDGASGSLKGTLTEKAVNGIATFDNLSIQGSGSYTLKATDGSDTDATSDSFTVGPVELQGDFDDGKSEGTVEIGLAPTGGAAFLPLMEVSGGSVSYDDESIQAKGTFSSLVGNACRPLFEGSVTIDQGQTASSTLSASSQLLKIAGGTFSTTKLTLTAPALILNGNLELPSAMGGGTINMQESNSLVFNADGIKFDHPETLSLPAPFQIDNVAIGMVNSISLSYDSEHDGLQLQGSASATLIDGDPKVDFDFTGDNYIEYDPTRNWTVVGTATASDLDLTVINGILTIDKLTLGWKADEISFGASLNVMKKVDVDAEISLSDGKFNGASLTASKLGVQLPDGFYLQSLGGSISHLADLQAVTLTGSMEISLGQSVPGLGGYLWSAYGQLTIDSQENITGTATVSDLGDAASGKGLIVETTSLSANLKTGAFGYTATTSLLNGTLRGTEKFTVDANGQINASGTGVLKTPAVTLLGHEFAQQTLGSVTIVIHIANPLSGSYIAAWGYVKIPGNSAPFLMGVEENLGSLTTTWLDKNTPLPAV